jgi:hypothetical protein
MLPPCHGLGAASRSRSSAGVGAAVSAWSERQPPGDFHGWDQPSKIGGGFIMALLALMMMMMRRRRTMTMTMAMTTMMMMMMKKKKMMMI